MKKIALSVLCVCMSALVAGCGGKSAGDYNKEGMQFYESGDYDQAEDYLNKAVSMDGDNVEYLQNHAMILIQKGRQDEAIEEFEKTISNKKSSSAKKNCKYAYRGIGMAYLQKQEYAKAIENFEKALNYNIRPEWDTDIMYYKANAILLGGDVDGALKAYTEIIEKDPENALAYKARANVYRDKNEYQAALGDYNKALLHMEGGFEIYIGLAACYLEVGRTEQAKEALFLASLLDIKTDKDKYYLGVIHYYEQKFDSAKSEMEYALANGIEEAYFYLAEINLIQENYEEALKNFKLYQETTVVVSPTLCNDLAVCYINAGDFEEAEKWIDKGLGYNTSGVLKELKRNRIACAEGKGELDRAYALALDYHKIYPDDEAAFTELKWLADRLGETLPENFDNLPDSEETGDSEDTGKDEDKGDAE